MMETGSGKRGEGRKEEGQEFDLGTFLVSWVRTCLRRAKVRCGFQKLEPVLQWRPRRRVRASRRHLGQTDTQKNNHSASAVGDGVDGYISVNHFKISPCE